MKILFRNLKSIGKIILSSLHKHRRSHEMLITMVQVLLVQWFSPRCHFLPKLNLVSLSQILSLPLSGAILGENVEKVARQDSSVSPHLRPVNNVGFGELPPWSSQRAGIVKRIWRSQKFSSWLAKLVIDNMHLWLCPTKSVSELQTFVLKWGDSNWCVGHSISEVLFQKYGCRQEQGPEDWRQEGSQEEDHWPFHQEGLVSILESSYEKLHMMIMLTICQSHDFSWLKLVNWFDHHE